jgi:hypothetical protein
MTNHNRQNLYTLPPDLINKARDDTDTQVNRLLLAFVGTAAFCLLSLLSPDSALLAGRAKMNVPLAGPVSFFGFTLLGPAVLIALRVYLQIYASMATSWSPLQECLWRARQPWYYSKSRSVA